MPSLSARNKQRSSHPAAFSPHPIKAGWKWRGESREEELIGSNYLQLGENGKSDQIYAMSAMAIEERSEESMLSVMEVGVRPEVMRELGDVVIR